MKYSIIYYSAEVEAEIMTLPRTLQARYISMTKRMAEDGANLGEPHTQAFGDGFLNCD